MAELDEASERRIAAVVAGVAQMRDLSAAEREIAHSRIDARISARAAALRLGEVLVAEGRPAVFMNADGDIVEGHTAGE